MDSAGASSSPVDSFISKTPEKPISQPRRPLTRCQSLRSVNQVREAAKKLPISDLKPSISSEKYEMLNSFFDRLLSSIQLLGLKRSTSTFTNIRKIVESLTDRSFSYGHLAQLKFILPEAIEIKKILVRDDRTCCVKPDLHITLNFSIVQKDNKQSFDYSLLSKLFRSRLSSFCKSNPEGDEVPEAKLPEPFTKPSYSYPVQKPNLDTIQDTTPPVSEHQPVAASLFPQSFKRRFSKQISTPNVEPVQTQVDHKLPETPVKNLDLTSTDATPVKLVSTPFSATPAQSARALVRCLMTPDQDPVMHPSKLTRRPGGKRSINFDTPVERVSTDEVDILSDDLLASIKENELKVIEAKWRKKMIAGLPKLFDTLWFYFQSVKRTVVTKEELMNMLTSSQIEIVDKKEAEEQLRLLQELAPEWIYEKVASSGDLLCCVNKISSSESIRARLSSAN